MTMPSAAGGDLHRSGLLYAGAAALGGIALSAVAGWLGFFIFFAGYLTTWFMSIAYLKKAGPPTRKNLPSLIAVLLVAIVLAYLASEFGAFYKQAADAGIGGNLLAYFWTVITDPYRWSQYLWIRAGLFGVFSLLGGVGLFRAMGPSGDAALDAEMQRLQRGQYQPQAGSSWGPPGGTPTGQPGGAPTGQPGAQSGAAPQPPGQTSQGYGRQGYGSQGYGPQPSAGYGPQPSGTSATPAPQSNPGSQGAASTTGGYPAYGTPGQQQPGTPPQGAAAARPDGQPAASYGSQPDTRPAAPQQPWQPQPAGPSPAQPPIPASNTEGPGQSGFAGPSSGYFDPSQGEGLGTPPAQGPDFTMGDQSDKS